MQDFTDEFKRCWFRLENKPLFFVLLGLWIIFFQFLGNSTFGYIDTPSLLTWMYKSYTSEQSEDGHGLLIPFAVLALFWWKRHKLLEIPTKAWSPGLILVGLSLLLHIFGYMIQQPRISIVAFFVGIYASIGVAWGWRWMKASFFPFVLFVFCMPIGSLESMNVITQPLRILSTTIATAIGNGVFGFGIVRQGTLIFDPTVTYSYDVTAACSGIRSLISLLVLTMIYGLVSFKSPWKRSGIILMAFPLAITSNVLRLLSVIVAAEMFGQEAGNFVHEWSGFLTYPIALACLFGVSHFWRERETKPVLLETKPA